MLVMIGNHTAYNNEKQPYRIIGIKRSRHEKKMITNQFTNVNIHFFSLKEGYIKCSVNNHKKKRKCIYDSHVG